MEMNPNFQTELLPVLCEADLMTKSLVAELACVGAFSIVGSTGVDFQSMGCREDFVTFHAGVDVSSQR